MVFRWFSASLVDWLTGWLIDWRGKCLIDWLFHSVIESLCYPEVDLLKATSTGMPTVCFSGGRKFIANQIFAEKGTLTTEKIWVQCVLRILDENLPSHFLEEETPSGNHHCTGSMSKKTTKTPKACSIDVSSLWRSTKITPHEKTGVLLHYIRWTWPFWRPLLVLGTCPFLCSCACLIRRTCRKNPLAGPGFV